MAEYSGLQTSSDDQVGGRTEKLCEPCLKKKIRRSCVVFCADCKQFQCSKCREAHELFDVTSGHAIRPITDIAQQPPRRATEKRATTTLDMKGIDKCEEHDKPFEFFCVDHDILCCSTCAIKGHRKCNEVNAISDHVAKPFGRSKRINLRDVESTFTKLKSRTTTILQDSKKRNNTVKQRMEDIPKAIDRMKESVIQLFDAFKRKTLSEARSAEHLMLSENNAKQSNLNEAITSLEVAITVLKKTDELGSQHEKFIALTVLESKLKYAQQLFEECKNERYTLEFCLEFNNALNLTNADGTVGLLHIDKNYSGDASTVLTTSAKFYLLFSTDVVKSNGDNSEPIYTGLAFLPDGRLAVVDGGDNCALLVLRPTLKELGRYTFTTYPFGVVAISNNEVVVTGGAPNTMHFLGVSQNGNIILIRTLNTSLPYQSISIIDENAFAVTSYDDKRPMRMISVNGRESDFKGLYEHTYESDEVQVACIRSKPAIVLSDNKASVIYIYDSTDEQCTTRCVVRHAAINSPKGVCPGPTGCFFVCSEDNNSIVQVSLTGKVLASFPADIQRPRTISISKDGTKLAVSGGVQGNPKIKLFSIS